jgi:hypothetical protein
MKARIELLQLLPACPYGRKDPSRATVYVSLCLLLAVLHGFLLEPIEKRCSNSTSIK